MLAAFQQNPTSSLTGRTSRAARGINVIVIIREINNVLMAYPPAGASAFGARPHL